MTTTHARPGWVSPLLFLVGLALQGCTANDHAAPRAFASPDDAVQALATALRADDTPQLLAIMGSDVEQVLSSGDPVADRLRREKFLSLYDQKHALRQENPDRATLVVGNADWPFPIPVVRQGAKWHFDLDEGLDEILSRRIGENELSAIEVCKAIVDAQREYALRNPAGDGVRAYAQKFVSDPGKRNGLYWPAADGEEPSPLGEFAAAATAEGYKRRDEGPTPYHGYYYRILTAQGPGAPDGAVDYVVDGRMTLGFAVLAHPADYGNSGVMTFMVGPDGTVYQKDLGEQTAQQAVAIQAFDPGEGWKKVE